MKKIILILILSLGFVDAKSQCEDAWIGDGYYSFPNFYSLYLTGKCISGQIGDTTICVRYPQVSSSQIAYFSYSSPTGQPAYITQVSQYSSSCEFMGNGTAIPPGDDTITVCYTIQAEFIDNFCPYAIITSPLKVDWCGIYAYWSNGLVNVRWVTCSNSNTKRFDVIVSDDAVSWQLLKSKDPVSITSSTELDYKISVPFSKSGIHYVAVREVDFDGNVSVSDIVYFEVPYVTTDKEAVYDLLGRRVSDQRFMYYVSPKQ